MLEIRNVTKVYKPKKGVPVKALDNVSLKFPEKGMVFILGKSGSGKSTLLNILGGLDRADEGEIIIKGKSSKDFTQSDFDSYRNTYLGFIFQEYNILNEFTVGANIGLALELQGKKATNEEINKILEEVDLVGYGNRKPTELSGGQKQRVAIARALVKNPEIILADEPTGALDSKTGIQVFETLKKLSKDKLVIVVSHDREFAEYYGDRVIELKDGRVISDIEKYYAPSFKKNPHLSIVDDKIISIKQGYQLTEEDVALINNYLKNHNAIISVDERANDDLRKFARIDLEGNKEAFKETDESKIKISQDKKFKLIKSRLPWKNSVKIGASGLKSKPFRLVMTIILSVVAFTMAGLSDTMGAYNKYAVTTQSFIDSKISAYVLEKQKHIYYDEDRSYPNQMLATDEDIERLNKETGLEFKGLYKPSYAYIPLNFYILDSKKSTLLYERIEMSGFFEITQNDINALGFSCTGELPQQDNQIAISEYIFNCFKTCGYSYQGLEIKAEDIRTAEDFLNKKPKFYINNKPYTITAVIDTKFDYDNFRLLNESEEIDIGTFIKLQELYDTVLYGYHGMIFVNDGFVKRALQTEKMGLEITRYVYMNLNFNDYYNVGINNVISQNEVGLNNIIFFEPDKTKVEPNEIVLSVQTYLTFFDYMIESVPQWYEDYKNYSVSYQDFDDYLLNEYIPKNYPKDFYVTEDFKDDNDIWYRKDDYTLEKMQELPDEQKHAVYFAYLKFANSSDWGDNYSVLFANYFKQKKIDLFIQHIKNGNVLNEAEKIGLNSPKLFYSNTLLNKYLNLNYKIVGVFDPGVHVDAWDAPVILDDQLYEEISEVVEGYYMFLITPMPSSENAVAKLVKFGYDNYFENDVSYRMRNGVMSTLGQVNSLIETLAKVFLYIGIGFAVFAALLLMNFITISISYKSKEIGILRAIGARSSDVFGIFFNEAMIIALINFALSVVATALGVMWLNSILRKEYQILITLLIFGIRQLILMLIISVGVAFISSFFPVMRVARKKPVDAMKK
ncbi:MAG TPA: ABC transporter ATP-binding protein/permease [Clostridia bacterium]